MKPRAFALLPLLALAGAALACNLPTASGPSGSALRKTLDARLTAEPVAQATAAPPGGSGESLPAQPGASLPGYRPTALPGAGGALPVVLQSGGAPSAYVTLPGDTLAGLSGRFGLEPNTVQEALPAGIDANGLLPAGISLALPYDPDGSLNGGALLPDGEVVYGPSSADLDITALVQNARGYLASYREPVKTETLDGVEIVRRIALETSINPRLLLAVLDYRSNWVSGSPKPGSNPAFPIGYENGDYAGLYGEITLTARYLTQGYYGWRAGTLKTIPFANGAAYPPDARLNAGSIALQHLFARLDSPQAWAGDLYGAQGFAAFYAARYGDPWARAAAFEPLWPAGLQPPAWELPFPAGEDWSFSGGPHLAWGVGSPLGALDFAPAGEGKGCFDSRRWATASAPGVVARSERGQLALDLDGDGKEQTGWVLFYLHLADRDRLPAGVRVAQDQALGHPSCEGGPATGNHVHIARKFNGEWVGVTLPGAWTLSGWQVLPGKEMYQGQLVKSGRLVTAKSDGSAQAKIQR